ncbi:MAG: N-acetyltransferase [Acetobacteraceae bacterium]|nr:N-acetyltransferase [Acetobacteraceae bacterium]
MVRPRAGMDGTLSFGPERPEDIPAIRALHQAAFGGDYEADVIDGLRAGGFAFASLVARIGAEIVGHVMFSDMSVVVDGHKVPAAALAPLAVAEGFRGAGIGGRLVQMGLEAARVHGAHAVLVLGDPAYYREFGFDAAVLAHLRSPYPPGKLMALELVTGVLAGRGGTISYPPPFTRAQR